MFKRAVEHIALLVAATSAFPQSRAGPVFEVASVKADPNWRPGPPGTKVEVLPDGLRMHNASLLRCISWAYSLPDYKILAPDWISTDRRYDISAKSAGAVPVGRLRLMLRSLLAERFRLATHSEARELKVYALVKGKGEPRIRKSSGGEEPNHITETGPYASKFERTSMERLVEILEPPWMSLPVIDETGMEGEFDFSLDFGRYILDPQTGKPILQNGRVDIEGAILRAVPEQLGLALKQTKAPVEMLVVDHADKMPSGN